MACTQGQIRKLMKYSKTETLEVSAAKAGMSPNTARKYLRSGDKAKKVSRNWRTRQDPFADVWNEIALMLAREPLLEAKALLEWLGEQYPNKFAAGHLRTLQRRLRDWRATEGPEKEVFFPQVLQPGKQSQSDFTWCNELNVTIDDKPFPHMLFHFILPYSRWETFSIAHSESFDSLSEGYAAAVKELGAAAPEHRTDSLAAAVSIGERKQFQARWRDFLKYYGVSPSVNNPRQSHENGSIEKSHDLLKKHLDQRLKLRGSRNFASLNAYEEFVQAVVYRRNKDRKERLAEELKLLMPLPAREWRERKDLVVSVSPWSTVNILRSTYSVPSRLIGSKLKAAVNAKEIQLFFGTKCVQTMPRIAPGESAINYQHVISHLVRKPGAFKNYRFREELFPSKIFRQVHDLLLAGDEDTGIREYLSILHLAAMESETKVESILRVLLEAGTVPSAESIKAMLVVRFTVPNVQVHQPNLRMYDSLLIHPIQNQEKPA